MSREPQPTMPKTVRQSRGEIRLGDCLAGVRELDAESASVIVVDGPYLISKDFGNDSDKMELSDYLLWMDELFVEWSRVLKPNGSLFFYGFTETVAHVSVRLERLGFNYRFLIWSYENKNMASVKTWQRSHEAILYCWKDKPIFNLDAVREPYSEGFLKGSAGKTRQATKGRFSSGENETVYSAHPQGALPRDVLKIPALAGGAGRKERWFYCRTCKKCFLPGAFQKHKEHETLRHPTQKPLALTKRLLESSLPVGEARKEAVVLVPFAGSGSECVVAKKLGAVPLGFELNAEYVRLGRFVLKNASKIILP